MAIHRNPIRLLRYLCSSKSVVSSSYSTSVIRSAGSPYVVHKFPSAVPRSNEFAFGSHAMPKLFCSVSQESLKSDESPTGSIEGKRAEEEEEEKHEDESEDEGGGEYINPETGEMGGPRGPEPTRYGDWEKGGRCSDF
eukprot:Gb_41273 [translate_table: standard]